MNDVTNYIIEVRCRVVNIELLVIAHNYQRYVISIASFIGNTFVANYLFQYRRYYFELYFFDNQYQ